jgi:diguanylate cyclase (GGDEF)-like protein/PAS domain S-box-containing protein
MIRSILFKVNPTTRLLVSGFIVIIFLSVLIAGISLKENSVIAELNEKMYHHPFTVSNAVLEANADIIAMHRYMKDVVLATNLNELELAISLVEKHEQAVYRHFALIKERFLGDKKTVNAAFSAFVDWKVIRNEVVLLQRMKNPKKAAAITIGKGAEHVELLTQRMDVLINFARDKAFEFKNNSRKSYESTASYLYALLIFITLASIATAFFVITKVMRAERAREISEARFEGLFKNSVIPILSEDFTSVLKVLNNLRMQGVIDLKAHLQQNIPLAWDLASKVKVNRVNNATETLFGAKSNEIFMDRIDNTFGPNAINVFIEELCAIWDKQKTFLSEASFNTLDGKEIEVIVSFQIPTKTSDFHNVPVSIVDITERKKAEKQLKLSSRVFSDTHEGIIITDANRVIIDVNPSFSEITGYSRNEAIGQNPRILSSGKQSTEFYVSMWKKIQKTGHWQGEMWNRNKSGKEFAELVTISSLQDIEGNTTNYVGVFTDITYIKYQQDNIKKMAHYDALTSLPNRVLLTDRFNQALAHTKRSDTMLAVCFLDLDNFKPVNDTYGHDVGDKLLIEVARRLEATVRNEDTISRIGGDEFSLLLGDIKSIDKCYELLERIIHSVSATYFIDETAINISASIGVSLCPLDNVELDVLMRHADQAMYRAKQQGKNNFQLFEAKEVH